MIEQVLGGLSFARFGCSLIKLSVSCLFNFFLPLCSNFHLSHFGFFQKVIWTSPLVCEESSVHRSIILSHVNSSVLTLSQSSRVLWSYIMQSDHDGPGSRAGKFRIQRITERQHKGRMHGNGDEKESQKGTLKRFLTFTWHKWAQDKSSALSDCQIHQGWKQTSLLPLYKMISWDRFQIKRGKTL